MKIRIKFYYIAVKNDEVNYHIFTSLSKFFFSRISSELVHQLVHNFGNHTKAFQVYKDTLNSDPNNLDVKI